MKEHQGNQDSPRNDNISIQFALYSHWAVDNRPSADQLKDLSFLANIDDTPVVERIYSRAQSLSELLCPNIGPQGVLFLFFDPGWKDVLTDGSSSVKKSDAIEYARVVRDRIFKKIKKTLNNTNAAKTLISRIRIITAEDIFDIAEQLKERTDKNLFRWFVGEDGQSTYDSPKIMEAMIRLRMIGRNVPVFRLDHDVLLPPDDKTAKEHPTGITNATVHSLITEYNNRFNRNAVCWMFSAGYENQPNGEKDLEKYEFWSRAFATRFQPALVVTDELLKCVAGTELLQKPYTLEKLSEDDVNSAVEVSLCQSLKYQFPYRYYGIEKKDGPRLTACNPVQGLSKFGANPMDAVISGGGLNFSLSAIDLLPPFSNFSSQIMWIDDHLKYALHDTLDHFRNAKNFEGRVENQTVIKGRIPPKDNLVAYYLCIYIPTLVRGMIMDAWIRGPLPKEQGPLAKYVEQALFKGRLTERECLKYAMVLRNRAIERLREVQNFFSKELCKHVDGESIETLASIWACSRVGRLVKSATGLEIKDDSLGAGLLKIPIDAGQEFEDLGFHDIRERFAADIENLIVDAIDYVQMVAEWGGIIQTIRAQRINSLQVDLDHDPNSGKS